MATSHRGIQNTGWLQSMHVFCGSYLKELLTCVLETVTIITTTTISTSTTLNKIFILFNYV